MTEGPVDLPEVEVITTIAGLNAAAVGLQKAANRLYHRTLKFEGPEGIGTTYEIAVQNRRTHIYDQAIEEGRRPPAEDIRLAKAEQWVREEHPDLWREWRQGRTDIDALRIWISGMKQSISARQSVLRGERE